MGYCDITDADLIALTRQRRAEARARREAAKPPTLRIVGKSQEFERTLDETGAVIRAAKAAKLWRTRMWKAGNRACFYCECRLSGQIGKPNKATVDHRVPLGRGGTDGPTNWVMACLACNGRKADLSEAEFRALMKRAA